MTLWSTDQGTTAQAARALEAAVNALPYAPAYQALPADDRQSLRDRLSRVRQALASSLDNEVAARDPYDADVFAAPMIGGRPGFGGFSPQPEPVEPEEPAAAETPKSLLRSINDLPAATGAMMDEIGFAEFVASLVHGTFDAIVDSSIRQMEAFADLVASLSLTVDEFSRGNVTSNQARDWLVDQHGADLSLVLPTADGEQPRVVPRIGEDEWGESPSWLTDYGLDGETLSEELIEEQLVPQARMRLGEDRMRSLAAMALMGLNKVKVERGEVRASVRIRARAMDRTLLGFAQDHDGGNDASWSGRAGFSPPAARAMISTTINAQSDAAIEADLRGEVKVVFASETVPLDSFVSDAQRVLLERTARTPSSTANTPNNTAASTPTTATNAPRQIGQDAANAVISEEPAPQPQPAPQPTPVSPTPNPPPQAGEPT